MAAITLSYTGDVQPKKTTYLACNAIKVDLEFEIELEGSDAGLAKTVQAEFAKALGGALDRQLDALNGWLDQKSEVLGNLIGLAGQVEKLGLPLTEADARKFAGLAAEMQKISRSAEVDKGADKLKSEFEKIVTDWGQNVVEQQALIAVTVAVKKARVANWNSKKARMRRLAALKAALIIAPIAFAVVAVVLTAGAAAPAVLGITIALTSISGATGFARIGKLMKDNYNLQKRVVDQLTDDVEELEQVMGKASIVTGRLPKHASELSNLIKVREDQIADLKTDQSKLIAELGGLRRDIGALRGQSAADSMTGEIGKLEKRAAGLDADLAKLKGRIDATAAENTAARALVKRIEDLGADMAKVTSYNHTPFKQQVKEHLKSVDGMLETVEMISSTAGGVLSIASG